MITVCAWYWRQPGGRTQYSELNIKIWADMVRRNLSIPHRIACVTNEPIEIDGVDIIRPPREFEDLRLPSWPEHRPQCLRRLVMFRADAAKWFGERFACMDLDCVIGGSLDPVLGCSEDFRIAIGTAPGRPYNGSLIVMTAGARSKVYDEFTRAGAIDAGRKFVGSDQAWIAHCLGRSEATFSETDGVLYHGIGHSPRSPRRLVFYPGAIKPWTRLGDQWTNNNYRLSPRGRCLILGYDDKTLWRDVEAALASGPFAGVISSPEAAEHWPGEIVAVARDNREAARIAHLHGFDDVVWCGMGEREAA